MTASTLTTVGGIADLKTRMRGSVLEAADAGYDDARKLWNGMIDKRPAIIARCAVSATWWSRSTTRARIDYSSPSVAAATARQASPRAMTVW